MVNCELLPKFPLGHLSLPYIRAIDAYIFCSLLFSPFSHTQLSFSLKRTYFRRFSFSFGVFRLFAIRWSSDTHLKHFWGVHYIGLLSDSPSARDFSFSFLILLNHFYAEWLANSQKLHFVCTSFSLSLFLPQHDILSIFR